MSILQDMVTALMELSGLGSPAQTDKVQEGEGSFILQNDVKDEKVIHRNL